MYKKMHKSAYVLYNRSDRVIYLFGDELINVLKWEVRDMLFVTRHGQTTWNVEERICGRANAPLTEKGLSQANELALKVAETPITKILASPLDRARMTGEIVASYNHLPIETDVRLLEMDFGEYDGDYISDSAYFLELRKNFAFVIPGGESMFQGVARVYPLLDEVLADTSETYLLVCHNALMRVIYSYFHSVMTTDYFSLNIDNCELVTFH